MAGVVTGIGTVKAAAAAPPALATNSLRILAGGALTISGGEEKRLIKAATDQAALDNHGIVAITGGGRLFLIDDAQIVNSGTLALTAPVLIENARCCVAPVGGIINTGEIDVAALLPPLTGNIHLADIGLSGAGKINIAGGAVLDLDGGLHDLADGVAITGGGTLRFENLGAISLHAVTIDTGSQLELAAGAVLSGPGSIDGSGSLHWLGGAIEHVLTIKKNAKLVLEGADPKRLEAESGDTRLINQGVMRWDGSGDIEIRAQGGILANEGTLEILSDATVKGFNCCVFLATLKNSGALRKAGSIGGTTTFDSAFLENSGILSITNDRMAFVGGGQFTQELKGLTTLSGGTIASETPIMIERGGSLVGSGLLDGPVVNAGSLSPGPNNGGIGSMRISGSFQQLPSGTLVFDVAGMQEGVSADLLEVVGDARLDGTRNVKLGSGFQSSIGQSVVIMRYGARFGTFMRTIYDGAGNALSATYSEPAVDPANLSARGHGELTLAHPTSGVSARSASCLPRSISGTDKANQQKALDDAFAILTIDKPVSDMITSLRAAAPPHAIFTVGTTLPPTNSELATTGRLDGHMDDRTQVEILFAWHRIIEVFELATYVVDESTHAREMLDFTDFLPDEVAPLLSQRDYLVLVLNGEWDAFQSQSAAAAYIADIQPQYEYCRSSVITASPILTGISLGKTSVSKACLVASYSLADWKAAYQQTHSNPQAPLADIKPHLDQFQQSQKWHDALTLWGNDIDHPQSSDSCEPSQ